MRNSATLASIRSGIQLQHLSSQVFCQPTGQSAPQWPSAAAKTFASSSVNSETVSTVRNVTPDYPATFITDGNDGSFEPDARKLEAKLKESGVYVDSLYYPAEHGKLGREYQFF
jgi:hypothetical protein